MPPSQHDFLVVAKVALVIPFHEAVELVVAQVFRFNLPQKEAADRIAPQQ
jgi:hypothetical protein